MPISKDKYVASKVKQNKRVFESIDKDGEHYLMMVQLDENQCGSLSAIRFNEEEGRVSAILGHCDFIFDDEKNNECYLNSIEVTSAGKGIGVGHGMVGLIEHLTHNYQIDKITGQFSPFGPFADDSAYFYMRNGFTICESSYGDMELYKDLTNPYLACQPELKEIIFDE